MVLRSCATATLVLASVLAGGCGPANPAASLSECILEGAEKLATSKTETESWRQCDLQVAGPYKVMLFPPKRSIDQSAHQEAESALFALAKTTNLPGPTHESIWIIPESEDKALSYRRSFVPVSQIFSLRKDDSKLSLLLRKTDAGIEVAELR
jgi:hypothetical protein